MERADESTGRVRVVVDRLAVAAECEPVATPEGAEVVVERVVLHHEDDDVLDLRQGVGASREMGIGARSGCEQRTIPPKAPRRRRRGVGLAANGRGEAGRGQSGSHSGGQERPAGEPMHPGRALVRVLAHRRYANPVPRRLSVRTGTWMSARPVGSGPNPGNAWGHLSGCMACPFVQDGGSLGR